jgi:hypothetical protein
MSSLRRRPLWGFGMGLGMGVAMLLYAGIRVGSLQFPYQIAAMYLLGGAVGGLAVGLCLPLAHSRPGAALLGVVAMVPLHLLLGTLDAQVMGDEATGWWAYGLSAVLVGGLSGYVIRDTFHRDLDDRDPQRRSRSQR